MHIVFYGQLGLSQLADKDYATPENRVEALARQLVQDGHNVTVLGTPPYLSAGNFHGIELKRLPSLNPQQPGGWFYLILGLVFMLWAKPDVIHVHTNRAAFLLSIVRWFLRDTRLVWTIDSLSSQPSRFKKWVFRAITYYLSPITTTPLRSLQYRLLVEYGIKATYIPDGYHEPVIPPISAARFGLRAEQYAVALVNSLPAARFVTKAYTATKTRKKLVVIGLAEDEVKRLRKKFPLVSLVTGPPLEALAKWGDSLLITSRIRRSLIAGAAAVIIGDDTVSQTVLLEAMHHQRALVATNEPRYQETLGTAGRYIAASDATGLTATLKNLLGTSTLKTKLGQAASIRAQHHFTWSRVLEDYQILYAPQVRVVLVDSVQARPLVQRVNPRVQYS